MAILNQHRTAPIENDAARRTQRERPLMIVLGHLLELLVLHDLQHPEAHRENGEQPDHQVLEDGQPGADTAALFDNRGVRSLRGPHGSLLSMSSSDSFS